MTKPLHPLLSISAIVLLSLLTSAILFEGLTSSGLLKNQYIEFGGAAAGFFAALYFLSRWYDSIEKRHSAIEELVARNTQLQDILSKVNLPPDFDVPPSFKPSIDYENSMLFCYPQDWKQEPMKLRINSVYSEDPLKLQPGDEVPGKFSVVVSTAGQQTFSLKEVVVVCKKANISIDELRDELGIEYSEKNEAVQIPAERLFNLLGVEGKSRKDQIYEMVNRFSEAFLGKIVKSEIELVNGRESLLIESESTPFGGVGEPLIVTVVTTYLPESDMVFTFSFVDNLGDYEKIGLIRKQVLSTVKFWAS